MSDRFLLRPPSNIFTRAEERRVPTTSPPTSSIDDVGQAVHAIPKKEISTKEKYLFHPATSGLKRVTGAGKTPRAAYQPAADAGSLPAPHSSHPLIQSKSNLHPT